MSENLEIAKAWVDACNSGDTDAALALCDPVIVLTEADTLPGAISSIGYDEVQRYLEGFQAHWSEWSWEPIEFREAGDKVYLHARLKLLGRRSGIAVDREWRYVFTIRDGRLLRHDGFDEEAEALKAAGLA